VEGGKGKVWGAIKREKKKTSRGKKGEEGELFLREPESCQGKRGGGVKGPKKAQNPRGGASQADRGEKKDPCPCLGENRSFGLGPAKTGRKQKTYTRKSGNRLGGERYLGGGQHHTLGTPLIGTKIKTTPAVQRDMKKERRESKRQTKKSHGAYQKKRTGDEKNQ